MHTRPMPDVQKALLATAARHPMGRVPVRSSIHPATWSALYDRMFIGGPEHLEHITKAGRQALAAGRTIPLINIWSMRWARTTADACTDRATGSTVVRYRGLWYLEPDHILFPTGLRLSLHLEESLRQATVRLTNARKVLRSE